MTYLSFKHAKGCKLYVWNDLSWTWRGLIIENLQIASESMVNTRHGKKKKLFCSLLKLFDNFYKIGLKVMT